MAKTGSYPSHVGHSPQHVRSGHLRHQQQLVPQHIVQRSLWCARVLRMATHPSNRKTTLVVSIFAIVSKHQKKTTNMHARIKRNAQSESQSDPRAGISSATNMHHKCKCHVPRPHPRPPVAGEGVWSCCGADWCFAGEGQRRRCRWTKKGRPVHRAGGTSTND